MNPTGTSTRTVAAVTGVAVVAAGMAALGGPGPEPARATLAAPPASATPAATAASGPDWHTIDLTTAAAAAPRIMAAPSRRARAGTGAAEAGTTGRADPGAVAPRATHPFSLIGATWTDSGATLAGATIRVRTRATGTGTWRPWQELDADGRNAASPGAERGVLRGSTDPLWVGDSDGVEARVVAASGGTAALPTGLRLDLINPSTAATPAAGAKPAPVVTPAAAPGNAVPRAEALAAPASAVRARPVPAMVTRAGWGADESIVEHAPEYTGDVRVVFVHHTAGSNGYTCAQSASIVRGIELYHVRSNGWNDIGYNFLVDKCGTLFEGRRGGVHRAVLGAHTLGFNANSSAIAVLGNYDAVAAPPAARTVIAQVAAYKLGTYGATGAGRATLVSDGSDRYARGTRVSLNRISGHRDAGRTACPGDTLYGQLGAIRSVASAGPVGFELSRVTGARRDGSAYYTRGTVAPYWSLGTPSRLVWRFDVRVDGRYVTSAPAAHRAVTVRLGAGRHTVTVTAVHLSGRSASFARTVVVDNIAPVFGAGPSLALGTGSLDDTVPVRLGWAASDPGGLASVALTSPATIDLGVTARRFTGRVRAGSPATFTLRATDRTGNARAASVTRTASVAGEGDAARSGTWATLRSPAFLGGTAMHSTARNATATWTFTGRAASLAVSRTASSGRVKVYVDGVYTGVLDLRSAATQNRRAVWSAYFGASGRHTVRLAVEGTTGRPGVVVDGLVVLR